MLQELEASVLRLPSFLGSTASRHAAALVRARRREGPRTRRDRVQQQQGRRAGLRACSRFQNTMDLHLYLAAPPPNWCVCRTSCSCSWPRWRSTVPSARRRAASSTPR